MARHSYTLVLIGKIIDLKFLCNINLHGNRAWQKTRLTQITLREEGCYLLK